MSMKKLLSALVMPLLSMGLTAALSAEPGNVRISFVQPEKFTDFRIPSAWREMYQISNQPLFHPLAHKPLQETDTLNPIQPPPSLINQPLCFPSADNFILYQPATSTPGLTTS